MGAYKEEVTEDSVIAKYIAGEPMTLKEASLALFMYDRAHPLPGKKPPVKPMTEMGMLKFELRILQKLKRECEKAGLTWNDIHDYFCSKGVSNATPLYETNSVD